MQDVAAGMMAGILFQFGIVLRLIACLLLSLACLLSFQTFNAALHHDLGVSCRSFLILGKMNPVDVSFSLAIRLAQNGHGTQHSTSLFLSQSNRSIFTGYGDYETQRFPAKPIITVTSIASLAVASVLPLYLPQLPQLYVWVKWT